LAKKNALGIMLLPQIKLGEDMIPETDVASFLDIFGFRGNCKECQEPIWWVRNKKSQIVMCTVNLKEHKHAKAKVVPINEIRRESGGENHYTGGNQMKFCILALLLSVTYCSSLSEDSPSKSNTVYETDTINYNGDLDKNECPSLPLKIATLRNGQIIEPMLYLEIKNMRNGKLDSGRIVFGKHKPNAYKNMKDTVVFYFYR
jgi:hypothetical protein